MAIGKFAPGLRGFPSPDFSAAGSPYLLFLFGDPEWAQYILGACEALAHEYNWYKAGELETDEAADAFRQIIEQAPLNLFDPEIEAPFWEQSDGDDADDQQPASLQDWFGYLEGANFVDDLAGWVFTGAVAIAYGPDAAVKFATGLRRFRLLFRTGDAGGIIKVLLDGDQAREIDTYTPEPGLIAVDIASPGTDMLIVNTGTGNPAATPVDGNYMMAIVKKELSIAEVAPGNQRYDNTSDQFQTTYDGGTTWTDTPQSDPRHADVYRRPANTGSDPKCLAAGNMIDFTKSMVDTFVAGTSAVGVANDFLTIILLLLPAYGWFIDLIFAVVAALIDIGSIAVATAFTDACYDRLLCYFYCAIDDDGQMNAAQGAVILAKIQANEVSACYLFMGYLFNLVGEVGFSNAGTIGESTRDCSGCDCAWSYKWTFTASDGDWYGDSDNVNYAPYWGTWVSAQGWTAVYNGHSNGCGTEHDVCIRTPSFDIPAGSQLTGLHFASRGYNCGHSEFWCGTSRSEGLTAGRLQWYNSGTVLDNVEYNATGAPIESETGVYLNMGFEWPSDQWIYWAIVDGVGDKPAFTGGEWL